MAGVWLSVDAPHPGGLGALNGDARNFPHQITLDALSGHLEGGADREDSDRSVIEHAHDFVVAALESHDAIGRAFYLNHALYDQTHRRSFLGSNNSTRNLATCNGRSYRKLTYIPSAQSFATAPARVQSQAIAARALGLSAPRRQPDRRAVTREVRQTRAAARNGSCRPAPTARAPSHRFASNRAPASVERRRARAPDPRPRCSCHR